MKKSQWRRSFTDVLYDGLKIIGRYNNASTYHLIYKVGITGDTLTKFESYAKNKGLINVSERRGKNTNVKVYQLTGSGENFIKLLEDYRSKLSELDLKELIVTKLDNKQKSI